MPIMKHDPNMTGCCCQMSVLMNIICCRNISPGARRGGIEMISLLIFLGKQRNFIGTVNIFILHRFYIGVGGSDRCLMSELKCRTNKRDEIVSPLTTRTSFPKLLLSNGRRTTSRDIKATGTSDGFSFTRDGLGNMEDSCTSTYATIENPCFNLLRIHSGVIGELVGIKLNFPYFQSMANIKLDVHNIWNAHALTHNYTRRNGCE